VTPGIKKILDDELAQNVGLQPTIQVLYVLIERIKHGDAWVDPPH
jgi:hypothetical protein